MDSKDYYEESCYEGFVSCLGKTLGCFGSLVCCAPYKEVNQGYVGVLTRFGKHKQTVRPGLHYVVPYAEQLDVVDTRIVTLEVPQQQVLTKDNVYCSIEGTMRYHIIDAALLLSSVRELDKLLVQCAMHTIRSIFGNKCLQEILERRKELARDVQVIVEQDAKAWGIHIDAILIKDLVLDSDVQQQLASSALAKRLADAKVISAQADVDSAKLMREAADMLSTDAAMQMRYLDQVGKLATSSNAKIVFFPADVKSVNGIAHPLNLAP